MVRCLHPGLLAPGPPRSHCCSLLSRAVSSVADGCPGLVQPCARRGIDTQGGLSGTLSPFAAPGTQIPGVPTERGTFRCVTLSVELSSLLFYAWLCPSCAGWIVQPQCVWSRMIGSMHMFHSIQREMDSLSVHDANFLPSEARDLCSVSE